MMRWSTFLAVSILTVILVGCGSGNKSDNASNVKSNVPTSEGSAYDSTNRSTDTTKTNDNTQNKAFNFSEFKLDADYGSNQSYEIDFENRNNGADASMEDQRKNQKIEGNAAYTKLEPLFKQLKFDVNTPDAEVKKQILKVFNLDSNYKKVELDVKFSDGTKKKYTFTP
ncbi:YusW family protein [Rummeliibacillus sp. NPDC094406]|uniref:YusW family protein n=1 Tax=Rummeliibacillus sp. NPDC094406 TaxID=3364511 RepID=UPI00380BEBAF